MTIKFKKHYIDNVEFYEEICAFHKNDKISDNLWMKFYLLAENYSHLSCFRGYSYIEDMRSEAVLRCIKYIKSFDHKTRDNPFSYFTSVIHFSFLAYF